MKFRGAAFGVSTLAIVMATHPAQAQDAQEPENRVSTNEIVVTAVKRETSLQETPVAITALGGDALEEGGVQSAVDLGTLVPGADFSTNGGSTSITIRGVGSDGLAQPKDDPSVAAFLDGVYLARPASLAASLYDIERVEVLRGPQGTLYGRNATGGAMNIITRQPVDFFEAGGDITYGNYDALQLRGYANVPIGERVAFRASGTYARRDGYSAQLNPAFSDGDDADDWSARFTLRAEPVDGLVITGRASLFRSDAVGPQRTPVTATSLANVTDVSGAPYGSVTGAILVDRCDLANPPAGVDLSAACNDPRAIYTAFPDAQFLKSDTYSLTLDWELTDWLSFRSVTGYTEFVQDKDGTAFPFEPIDGNATFDYRTESDAVTQEFNLSFDNGGRLTGVLGYFYYDDDGLNLFDELPFNPAFTLSVESDAEFKSQSEAVFGEVNYEVLDGLTLTGGLRYTSDTKRASSITVIEIPFTPTITFPLSGELDSDSTDFKVGVDYEANQDLFFYLNYSTAFKSGGVNTAVPINLTYQPEKLKAWQGGMRSTWADGLLQINLDAYYYKYDNPQITQVLGVSLETQNANDAEITGAELTINANPALGLNLAMLASYADSSYGAAVISDIVDLDPFGGNVFGDIDITGNQVRFTPEWTLTFAPSYNFSLTDEIDVTARSEIYWQDDSFARPHNLPIDRIQSFTTVNASVRFDYDERLFLEVFGRNLTDKTIVAGRFVNPLHLAEYRPPRTYGVTAGFKFD